jgi:hypothetical protein
MSNSCDSCEVLYINGIKTHEAGCPKAYKDELRECMWCPSHFVPESNNQKFCSPECAEAYYG